MGYFSSNIQLIFKNYRKNKVKNSIIFVSVLFFALHSFYFIHAFSVNTINGDEFNFLPFVKAFLQGDEFWKEDYFLQYDLHRLILPNTLILISVALTKWNTIYLLYVGWSLISISLIFLYLLLRQTSPKQSWLIIPISAILFSPIHYGTILWSLANNSYLLVLCGFIGSIYFLNNIQKTRYALIPAVLFASVAMLSSFIGLIIWFIGIFSLLDFKKIQKTPLFIWITVSVFLLSIYFGDYTWQTIDEPMLNKSESYTINLFETIMILFSQGFVNNVGLLKPVEFLLGTFILASIFICPIFLKLKKISFNQIMPWLQFAIIGLIFAFGLFAMINYSDNYVVVNSTVYSIYAMFPQIACLVLVGITLNYFIKTNSKRKKIIAKILLILILVAISSLILVSYYIGWWHGFQMFEERIQYQNCIINSNPISDCLEPGVYNDYIGKNISILRELELGPIDAKLNFNDHSDDPLLITIKNIVVGTPIQIDFNNFTESKPDGTPWNDPTNVIMDYTKNLQINLEKTYYSQTIELSLDGNDTYSIKFFIDENLQGREILYTNNHDGLKTYVLNISEAISVDGYNNIRIQPISGDEKFSFGHMTIK